LAYSNDAANWTLGVENGSPGEGDPDLIGARVVEVRLGGTTWGRPSVEIPVGTDLQLAPLPWETIDQITITFSEPVTVEAGALKLEGVNAAEYAVTPDVAADVPTLSMTWTIAAALAADRLELDLESEAVLDEAGNLLDGDWTDAASLFPSGDGTNGGDFRFSFNVLPGDVDRSGLVELADRQAVFARMFNSIGMADYRDTVDIDGNGKVTVADVVRVRNHMDSALPAGAPSAARAPSAASVLASPANAFRFSAVPQPIIVARRRSEERPLVPHRVDAVFTEALSPALAKLRAVRGRRPETTG
jgi:hypothetical protein